MALVCYDTFIVITLTHLQISYGKDSCNFPWHPWHMPALPKSLFVKHPSQWHQVNMNKYMLFLVLMYQGERCGFSPCYFASWNPNPGAIFKILSSPSTEVSLQSQIWIFTLLSPSCEIFFFLSLFLHPLKQTKFPCVNMQSAFSCWLPSHIVCLIELFTGCSLGTATFSAFAVLHQPSLVWSCAKEISQDVHMISVALNCVVEKSHSFAGKEYIYTYICRQNVCTYLIHNLHKKYVYVFYTKLQWTKKEK